MKLLPWIRRLLGRSTRPIVDASSFGATSKTYFNEPPRCESRKREGSRSWRCTKDADHVFVPSKGFDHLNGSGGRSW